MVMKDEKPQWFTSVLIRNRWVVVLSSQELADKPIIRKFIRYKVYSSFKDNTWGVDLADMQLVSKYNNGFTFLLCATDIFSKYAWAIPLKDKKGATIVDAFQNILTYLWRKPN